MNRFVAVAVVVVAMPFVVGLARASFGQEPVAPTVVSLPKDLTAIAEPTSLGRKYGLAVVAMPQLPSADGRSPNPDSLAPTADGRLANPETRTPIFGCPDIRAIVTGDSAFAIVAWDDSSSVVSAGQTVSTPAGPVKVGRIRSTSIAFAQADTTLQCKLPVR